MPRGARRDVEELRHDAEAQVLAEDADHALEREAARPLVGRVLAVEDVRRRVVHRAAAVRRLDHGAVRGARADREAHVDADRVADLGLAREREGRVEGHGRRRVEDERVGLEDLDGVGQGRVELAGRLHDEAQRGRRHVARPGRRDAVHVADGQRGHDARLVRRALAVLHLQGLAPVELLVGLEVAVELAELAAWAGRECEIPNFKGSSLGRFPLVSADFWTSDRLSERSRRVDDFSGTRARGTLTLKRR